MGEQIVMIKLLSGEIIFGLLASSDDETITLRKPTVFIQSQEGLTPVPWVPIKEDSTVTFYLKNLTIKPVEEENLNDNLIKDLTKYFFGIETPSESELKLVKN